MLTNTDIKLIRSLSRARERQELGLFPAEGRKLIGELFSCFPCRLLIGDKTSLAELSIHISKLSPLYRPQRVEEVPVNFDFTRISNLKQPQPLIALFELPVTQEEDLISSSLPSLAILLDQIQDPGNMGTIIRTADWFGVKHIYLTEGCADPFAPKVVQATMGALGHISLITLKNSSDFLKSWQNNPNSRIVGTFLDGENLYEIGDDLATGSILLVMGNEGKGISAEVEAYVSHRITIPPYSEGQSHTESLNVSVATAICLSELRRNSRY